MKNRNQQRIWSFVLIVGFIFGNIYGGVFFQTTVYADAQVYEDFEEGTWQYAVEPQTGNENALEVVEPDFGAISGNKALRFEWEKAYHDQSDRATRSSEVRTERADWERDIWESFYYYFPEDGFERDSLGTVIKQWIAWNSDVPDCNKSFDLEVVNDALYAHVLWNDEENTSMAHPHDQAYLVSADLPKNTWVKFEMHYRFDLDSPDGLLEIWMNDMPMLQLTDIQMGVGINSYGPYAKYGPYVYNSSTFEQRYMYADDIQWSYAPIFDHTGDVFPDRTIDDTAWYGQTGFVNSVHYLGDYTRDEGIQEIEFDVTPFLNYLDGCIGYMDSSTLATSYSSMNMIVRLNNNGYFDVRNGSGYEADTSVSYVHDTTYHIRMETDIATQTYSVWVTDEQDRTYSLATDYSYRTGAPSIDDIGQICLIDSVTDGQFKVNNHRVNGEAAPIGEDKDDEDASTVVVPVKDNRQGIVTMIMDDGYEASTAYYKSAFEANGLKGSLALITDWVDDDPQFWQDMVASGYFDIQSHSVSHMDLSQTDLDQATIEHEVIQSKTILQSLFEGQEVLGFVAPENKSNGASDEVIIQHYAAMRKGVRGFNSLSPSQPDWYNLMVQGVMNTASEATMNGWLDTASDNGKWLIEMWHGVASYNPNTYNPVSKTVADNHLAYMGEKQEQGDLWVATFGEAIKYIRQRQAADITVVENASSIEVTYTDDLDDSIYDEEVTLRSEVPTEWEGVEILHNGTMTQKNTVVESNGIHYVYYNAVPDQGVIILSEGEYVEEPIEEPEAVVYIEEDFESGLIPNAMSIHEKDNRITVEESAAGNHYLMVEMAEDITSDAHVDIPLSLTSQQVTIGMRLSYEDLPAVGNIQYKDSSQATKYLLYIKNGRIMTTDYATVCQLESGSYTEVTLHMNLETGHMTIDVDGMEVIEDYPIQNVQPDDTMTLFRLYMNKTSQLSGGTLIVDDIDIKDEEI